jgi:Cu(I)/Ag(I) efflux system protein CusF
MRRPGTGFPGKLSAPVPSIALMMDALLPAWIRKPAMKRLPSLVVAASVSLFAAAALAQAAIDGEVKKVDKPAGRITLQHAEVKQFDMPPMTGAYRVASPALLDRVQPGDHVRFSLDRLDSQYTITKIDVVK